MNQHQSQDESELQKLRDAINHYVGYIARSQPRINQNDTAMRDIFTILAKASYENGNDWGFVEQLTLTLWDFDPELANVIDGIRMKRIESGQYRANVQPWIEGDSNE